MRVSLSNNHTLNGIPFHDICDDVKGVYPKDFKFRGWHPKCRCHATPELAKREERIAYLKKMANGEDVSGFKFSGQTKEVPQGFKDWMSKNAERIKGAEERGKLPYFLRDNKKYFELKSKQGAQEQPTYKGIKLGRKATKKAYEAYSNVDIVKLSEAQIQNMDEIAMSLNITRKEMTFYEANSGRGNIYYSKGGLYEENCQCCIAIHEARLRGINVTAKPYCLDVNSVQWELGEHFERIWINPKTNKIPEVQRIKGKNDKDILDKMRSQTQAEGRYHIGLNFSNNTGHAIVAERLRDGSLFFYDAQSGKFINIEEYINFDYIEILKVDKLLFNKEKLLKILDIL